jgi:hypothetical protein
LLRLAGSLKLGVVQAISIVRTLQISDRPILIVQGDYPGAVSSGLIPCSDAACEIIAVGDDVTAYKPGDRVIRGCLKSPHRCKDYEGRVQTSRVIDPIAFSLMLDRLVKSRLFKHPLRILQHHLLARLREDPKLFLAFAAKGRFFWNIFQAGSAGTDYEHRIRIHLSPEMKADFSSLFPRDAPQNGRLWFEAWRVVLELSKRHCRNTDNETAKHSRIGIGARLQRTGPDGNRF